MAKYSTMQRKLLWRINHGIDPLKMGRQSTSKIRNKRTCLQSLVARGIITADYAMTSKGEEVWGNMVSVGVDKFGYVDANRPGWVKDVLAGKNKKKKDRNDATGKHEPVLADSGDGGGMEADWGGECEVCGATPVVAMTGMCGPCTFGEADTAGGNW